MDEIGKLTEIEMQYVETQLELASLRNYAFYTSAGVATIAGGALGGRMIAAVAFRTSVGLGGAF